MNTFQKLSTLLSTLDLFVFCLILFITLGFIIFGHLRRQTNGEKETLLDLMLMGRKLTLPLFVATLVATWYGGIFGVSQIAFEYGIFNFITQGFFWYITYIIFAVFLLKKIRSSDAVTLPDLIHKSVGPQSAKLAAVMNILNLVPIVYTISLGLIINMVFGIEQTYAMAIGVSCVLMYSMIGGLRSVVYSDVFQFFVMFSSVILVLVLSYFTYGLDVFKTLPDYYFQPMSKFTLLETLAWGLIALSTLVDPNFYQRAFAAKSLKVARNGIFISTCFWIIFDFSLTMGAIYARTQLASDASEYGYFTYALQLLPDGLRGFFLAGICATILSTLDSYLFLAATTLSYDLLPKKYNSKIASYYICIILISALSIFLATVFDGNIKSIWKTLGSLSSCTLLFPLLFNLSSKKKLKDHEFLIVCLAGGLSVIYWRLSGMKAFYNLDEIYIGITVSISMFSLVKVKSLLFNQTQN